MYSGGATLSHTTAVVVCLTPMGLGATDISSCVGTVEMVSACAVNRNGAVPIKSIRITKELKIDFLFKKFAVTFYLLLNFDK
jgi:hypothetical protein